MNFSTAESRKNNNQLNKHRIKSGAALLCRWEPQTRNMYVLEYIQNYGYSTLLSGCSVLQPDRVLGAGLSFCCTRVYSYSLYCTPNYSSQPVTSCQTHNTMILFDSEHSCHEPHNYVALLTYSLSSWLSVDIQQNNAKYPAPNWKYCATFNWRFAVSYLQFLQYIISRGYWHCHLIICFS